MNDRRTDSDFGWSAVSGNWTLAGGAHWIHPRRPRPSSLLLLLLIRCLSRRRAGRPPPHYSFAHRLPTLRLGGDHLDHGLAVRGHGHMRFKPRLVFVAGPASDEHALIVF